MILFLLIVTYGFSGSKTDLCLPLLDDVRSLVLKDLLFILSCPAPVNELFMVQTDHTNTRFIALAIRLHTQLHTVTVVQTFTFIQTERLHVDSQTYITF